jgi:hypothetical protein
MDVVLYGLHLLLCSPTIWAWETSLFKNFLKHYLTREQEALLT